MKDFIEYLAKAVVKNPDKVEVSQSEEGSEYRFVITVDPSDMGLVIGKEGRTISSIRTLAKAKAVKEGIWVSVELSDQGDDQAN